MIRGREFTESNCCCQARKPSNGTAVDAGFFKPTDESCVRSQNLSGTHGIEFGDS